MSPTAPESKVKDDPTTSGQGEDSTDPPASSSSSSSSSDQPPPQKRKRLAQACEPCRRKKVKCNGQHPTCSRCAALNLECNYVPRTGKRKPRQGYIETLEQRLRDMERLL
ncbi:MAG: hypothetical protein DHS80DRAFT_16133, partial [Piptocephalis tieghemiana]